MTPSARKRLLIGTGGFVGLLIVALLALPSLIDMNAYKPDIVAQAKQATGRDLVIDGPISLTMLPIPTVRLDGVRFPNAAGSKDPNMVEAKSIVVRPSLPALLVGSIEASEVTLVEPRIVLAIDAKGKPNWAFAPSTGEAQPLPVKKVNIENGWVAFSDARTGLSLTAGKTNLSASAGSMDGPFSMAGTATVDDTAVKVDLSIGATAATGYDADVVLEAAGGRLSFKGTVSELGLDARLSGKASASADNLVLFVETLTKISGQPRPHLPQLLAGKFRFEGPVELSRTAAASRDFTLVLGEDKGTGALTATIEPTLAVDARFTASRLDLDRWLKAVVLPPEVMDAKLPEVPSPVGPAPPPTTPPGPSWLAALNARLALEVGELIYNKQAVRNIAVALEARGGVVAVPKFGATLPGDLVVQAASTMSDNSAHPRVSGDFRLDGPKLRETLAWLGVDLAAVPADKLSRIAMHGKMNSRGGNVQVDDMVFELDDLKGKGGITVAFTVPLSIVTQLEIGTVDLDSFVVPSTQGSAVFSSSPTNAVAPILALLGPSLGLKLKVAKINYRGDTISGVDFDIARQAGTLKLNDFKVANLGGARLEVRGAVANYWTPQPHANVAFRFDAPDIDRVLKLAGAPPTGLGAVSASGGATGTWESLSIREGALSALGSTVRATGALALLGMTEGKIRSVSYKGNIVVNDQPIDASIEADLAGRPNISADLKAEAFDFGKLAGATRRFPARGQSAAESEAIDTASLRSFDGKFRLVAGTLGGATPMRFGNADIAAELKDGKLTIVHLKGGLYGGTLDMAGTVDATQQTLAFDLKGDANGIRVADMMRARSGTNEVGSLIKVTLDGILNANDIALRGTGATVGELEASLAGRARVSGHVHPRADRFLQVVGGAATGVTGGVIDATLGNLMSLFGDKGGVGVGNLLNAVSLVLNRFVNRDNPLAGEVDIANGILSDRQLQLQGSGATASIATRTNLGNATTDTTISFILTEDPSAPYLIMTMRGPLAGPAFSATRGSAKDPPGMVDVMSTIKKVPSLLPNISIPTPHIPNPFK